MGFLPADFIHDFIKNGYCAGVFGFRSQWPKWNPLPDAAVVGIGLLNVLGEHRSGPPDVPVVFCVRQDVSDVQFLPIVMKGCDEPEFVSSDVEDRKPVYLISRRKRSPQVDEGCIVGLTHNREPVLQRHSRVRMSLREVFEAFSRNDVHSEDYLAMRYLSMVSLESGPGSPRGREDCTVTRGSK